MSKIREEILTFADDMEAQLRLNAHKGGWSACTKDYLFRRLKEEVFELEQALGCTNKTCAKCRELIVKEAADVANFAMMIASQNRMIK